MFAFKNLRMVGVPQRSIHSGNMTLHSNLCDTSYSASVNVMVYPAGAILSSFHETRRPKPATPMTSSVIYKRAGGGARASDSIFGRQKCERRKRHTGTVMSMMWFTSTTSREPHSLWRRSSRIRMVSSQTRRLFLCPRHPFTLY